MWYSIITDATKQFNLLNHRPDEDAMRKAIGKHLMKETIVRTVSTEDSDDED